MNAEKLGAMFGEVEWAVACKALRVLGLVSVLAGCSVDPNNNKVSISTAPLQVNATANSASTESDASNSDVALNNIHAQLEKRKLEYDSAVRKAQMRGLAGGALQGGLLGILLTGIPEGAVVGGVAGGAVGYLVSGRAATKLVEDHRNFLIRKWSIETVLEAAKTDTDNTRFDLLISKRALDIVRSGQSGSHEIGETGMMHLLEFRERAEGRALVLYEFLPVVAADPVASEELSILLQKQVAMLRDMRKNIDEIEKSHD